MSTNPVVEVAKELEQEKEIVEDLIITLDDGMRVKIIQVSTRTIQKLMEKYPDPDPTDFEEVNQDTGMALVNYDHPLYKKQMAEAENARENAAMDALVMFGIELLDEIPNNGWERKVKKMGFEFDETDPFEREWAYKEHIAATADVIVEVSARSKGVSTGNIRTALDGFQDNEERGADPDSGVEVQS